jgi:hypothetical protein
MLRESFALEPATPAAEHSQWNSGSRSLIAPSG